MAFPSNITVSYQWPVIAKFACSLHWVVENCTYNNVQQWIFNTICVGNGAWLGQISTWNDESQVCWRSQSVAVEANE